MNEGLKEFLLSLNCTVINSVKKSLMDNTVVGYHCKSTSVLRKYEHLQKIEAFILENKLPYYISGSNENTATFFIYANKTDI